MTIIGGIFLIVINNCLCILDDSISYLTLKVFHTEEADLNKTEALKSKIFKRFTKQSDKIKKSQARIEKLLDIE